MSKIEWTEQTWNPVAGCEAVSPGCANCYAATITRRLEAMGQADYAGMTTTKHFNGKIRLLPHKLDIPIKRKKPTMYFVNSMSDLFHKDVPFEFIDKVFAVMALCQQHTFQVLTKRIERAVEYLSGHDIGLRWAMAYSQIAAIEPPLPEHAVHWCRHGLPNAWLGTSVENQEQADARIPHLMECPAAIRFLSCEPLLGSVDLSKWMSGLDITLDENGNDTGSASGGSDLDWVIVGGESGPGARPCNIAWIRSLVGQCKESGVACFVKQLGAHVIGSYREIMKMIGEPTRAHLADSLVRWTLQNKKGGDPAEWPEDVRVREMP